MSKKKNKSYLIWITGLSGSGKTSIAKRIFPYIRKKIGPTIMINGDDLRSILNLFGYDKKTRFDNGIKFSNLFKFIIDQNINILFAGAGLFHKLRAHNKRNIKNYIEIYIKSEVSTIVKNKKKSRVYKLNKNIYGIDIKPEFPKNPNITIVNNYDQSINQLSKLLIRQLKKKLT